LWGTDADGASILLVGRKAWLTPLLEETVPAGAWRDGKAKLDGKAEKKAKGEREEPESSEWLEVRSWTVVALVGTSFSGVFVRTGKRNSTFL